MVIYVDIDIYVHVSVPLARPVSEAEDSFVSPVYRNPEMQHGRESLIQLQNSHHLSENFALADLSETCGDKGRLLFSQS